MTKLTFGRHAGFAKNFLAAWREARHRAIRSKSSPQHAKPPFAVGFPLLSLAEVGLYRKVCKLPGLVIIVLLFCFSQTQAQIPNWKTIEVEGDTLLAHEDYTGALTLYSKVIKSSKLKTQESYLALYKRAVCQYSLAQFEAALQDLNRFIELQPEFYQANLLKAFIGRDLNDPEIQLEGLKPLILAQPKNAELLKWRIKVFLDDDQYALARKDIHVIQQSADDPELELYLGISYYYESKPDSAITHFDKAIALDRSFITPYQYAGSLCLDEEAYDLALHYLNDGLTLNPTNLSLIFYKGIALTEKNNLVEGCRCLTKAFEGGIDDAGDYLMEYCYGVED